MLEDFKRHVKHAEDELDSVSHSHPGDTELAGIGWAILALATAVAAVAERLEVLKHQEN